MKIQPVPPVWCHFERVFTEFNQAPVSYQVRQRTRNRYQVVESGAFQGDGVVAALGQRPDQTFGLEDRVVVEAQGAARHVQPKVAAAKRCPNALVANFLLLLRFKIRGATFSLFSWTIWELCSLQFVQLPKKQSFFSSITNFHHFIAYQRGVFRNPNRF